MACALADGTRPLPGGLIHQTHGWRVEHCTGPLGVGTLIVKPKRHVLYVSELNDDEATEMGPLLHQTATAVRELTDAQQVYICLWSHGPVHIHYVVQPALAETIEGFGVYGPKMQAAQFLRGEVVDPTPAAAFADRARNWFNAHRRDRG